MTACELCSGRHPTNVCALGSEWVEQCLMGTPDEYRPLPDNVVELITAHTHRSGDMTRRRSHHAAELRASTHIGRFSRKSLRGEGISVTRLG